MTTTTRTYTIAVYDAEPEEGGYWCEVMDLPGCVAQGDTLDELNRNVIEAISACEESREELGESGFLPRSALTWNISIGPEADVGGLVPA